MAGAVVGQTASRIKLSKGVMAEQREAEEELAVFMNQRLVKEVSKKHLCTQRHGR